MQWWKIISETKRNKHHFGGGKEQAMECYDFYQSVVAWLAMWYEGFELYNEKFD